MGSMHRWPLRRMSFETHKNLFWIQLVRSVGETGLRPTFLLVDIVLSYITNTRMAGTRFELGCVVLLRSPLRQHTWVYRSRYWAGRNEWTGAHTYSYAHKLETRNLSCQSGRESQMSLLRRERDKAFHPIDAGKRKVWAFEQAHHRTR